MLGIDIVEIERLREKGIDVKLTTDLMIGAFDNTYDVAVIVSSDGDLVPAIDWVRGRFKKKIEYVGFAHAPSLALVKYADFSKLLSIQDVESFLEVKAENT